MGIFSKAPAAAERKAFTEAEQRLQAVADRLASVQRDLAAARAKLAALRPGDTLEDLEAAATAFAAEHGRLQARVTFLQHARERLAGELADCRRAVLQAEEAVGAALRRHFADAADGRLKRLAGIVGEEVEALACELARASGSAHTRITMDSVLSALADAIADAGKASRNFGVGLAYAEAQGKIPAAPKSSLLSGNHRAGRDLDRLNPPIDAQAIRANLKALNSRLADHRQALALLERDPSQAAKLAALRTLIEQAEQSRAEYLQQLEQAEQHEALAV